MANFNPISTRHRFFIKLNFPTFSKFKIKEWWFNVLICPWFISNIDIVRRHFYWVGICSCTCCIIIFIILVTFPPECKGFFLCWSNLLIITKIIDIIYHIVCLNIEINIIKFMTSLLSYTEWWQMIKFIIIIATLMTW